MRRCLLLVAAGLVLTACGDSGAPTTTRAPPVVTTTQPAPTTTQPAPATTTTTTLPTTTTTTTSVTTTVPPTTMAPTTTTAPTTTVAPTTTAVDLNLLASGSGCTPGPGALPDGRWFGYVAAVSTSSIEFDLACWFSGNPAILASAQDGEESPPPNDYYIRNFNPGLRTVPIDPGAVVIWMSNPGDPATFGTVLYADWLANREARLHQPAIWINVNGGAATELEEQYQP